MSESDLSFPPALGPLSDILFENIGNVAAKFAHDGVSAAKTIALAPKNGAALIAKKVVKDQDFRRKLGGALVGTGIVVGSGFVAAKAGLVAGIAAGGAAVAAGVGVGLASAYKAGAFDDPRRKDQGIEMARGVG